MNCLVCSQPAKTYCNVQSDNQLLVVPMHEKCFLNMIHRPAQIIVKNNLIKMGIDPGQTYFAMIEKP